MRAIQFVVLAALAIPAELKAQAGNQLPAGWRARLESSSVDQTSQLVATPDGWHVTTNEAGFWWDTTMVQKKAFSVILEGSLRPGSANNAVGVFVGGRGLEGKRASWIFYQIRGDGTFNVEIRDNGELRSAVPWTPARGIPQRAGDEPMAFKMRLDVHPLRLDFVADGVIVRTLFRSTVRADGLVGLKLDAGLDMDVTEFKVVPIS